MIQVHTTHDYSRFKMLQGNRDVNNLHVKRLEQSISKNNLLTIITVNEKYEIIDGQHRYSVLKKLGLPINYIIVNGYGLNEIQILNANMKNWSNEDYLIGYIDLGYKDYIMFKEYKDKYKLNYQMALIMLTGNSMGGNVVNQTTKFKDGTFEITDINKAVDLAEKMLVLKKYYAGYNRRYFIMAIMAVLKNNRFNFTEFISKLELQPTALKDCINVTSYKELIEDIYNYRRREKVSLKY